MLETRRLAPEGTPWDVVSQAETPQNIPIDPNGNLIQKTENSSVWTYEWNAVNKLVRVTKDSNEVARFGYDPTGRRVEKVAGGVTYTYVYDKRDILTEHISSGNTFHYVHGPGMDEPLAQDEGTANPRYFHADALGSIAAFTESTGVVQSYRYESYGHMEQGGLLTTYTFTGRELDPETALYYYRARYYDSLFGRFLSEDPKRFADGPNHYVYVLNNPTGFVDPLGLQTTAEITLCITNPKNCSTAATCRDEAFQATLMRFGRQGHNDSADAFRHCFLACCLAQRMGSARKAQQFTDAHEAFPENPLCENKMDQQNNASGLALARSHPGGNCYVMCGNEPLQNKPVGQCKPSGSDQYQTYCP